MHNVAVGLRNQQATPHFSQSAGGEDGCGGTERQRARGSGGAVEDKNE